MEERMEVEENGEKEEEVSSSTTGKSVVTHAQLEDEEEAENEDEEVIGSGKEGQEEVNGVVDADAAEGNEAKEGEIQSEEKSTLLDDEDQKKEEEEEEEEKEGAGDDNIGAMIEALEEQRSDKSDDDEEEEEEEGGEKGNISIGVGMGEERVRVPMHGREAPHSSHRVDGTAPSSHRPSIKFPASIFTNAKEFRRRVFEVECPPYMGIEERPFDPDSYGTEEIPEEIRFTRAPGNESRLLANIIRWRYSDEEKKDIESNARVVQWSDGTWDLYIGKESFHISLNTLKDLRLCCRSAECFDDQLACDGYLMDRMMFSTDSMELLAIVKKSQQETVRSVLLDEKPAITDLSAPKGRQRRTQQHTGVSSVGQNRAPHDEDDEYLVGLKNAKHVEEVYEEDEDDEEEDDEYSDVDDDGEEDVEEEEEEESGEERRRSRDGENKDTLDAERKKKKKRKLVEKKNREEEEEEGDDEDDEWGKTLRDAGDEGQK
eukprot:TRINITY_DN173_c0_g1_i1.p1 TRINITY_DN173_c0_g1~~TRINITY_DN173_c0_g1_i1.p1  ORF type:complete len:487 (+),score=236.46 TRINITY_DN173_c0_g1_i1:256-1716(+)